MLEKLKKYFKKKVYRRKVFARPGEEITCENGHVICEVKETIYSGDLHDEGRKLHRWRQPPPKSGTLQDQVKCNVCGAFFWHGYDGQHYHFMDGWRGKPPLGSKSHAKSK